jgi:hypothetical protein
MVESMAYSCHSNPSSHISYIQAGHNSDFAFQKAVSGVPMPKKKGDSLAEVRGNKVVKVVKTRIHQKVV